MNPKTNIAPSRSQGRKSSSKIIIQNGMTVNENQQYQELKKQCDRMVRKAAQRRQQKIQNERDAKRYEAQMFKVSLFGQKADENVSEAARSMKNALDSLDQVGMTAISTNLVGRLNKAADTIVNLPNMLTDMLKTEGQGLAVELGLSVSRLVVSPTLAMVAIEIISIINKYTGCIADALSFFIKNVKGLFDWGNNHLRTMLQDRKNRSVEFHAEMFGIESVVPCGEWINYLPYGAGLAALLGSALLGYKVSNNHEASAEFAKWATFGANLSKARSGIKTVFDFVVFTIERVREYIVSKFPGAGISSSTISHFKTRYGFDLVEYVKEAMEITDPSRKEVVMADTTTRNRLDILLSKTTTILIDIIEEKVKPSPAVSSQLRDVRTKVLDFAKTFDALDSSSASRFTPFVVCLAGGPGSGKSVACDLLAKTLTDPRWCQVPVDQQNLIYARNSMDKFWSLYNGQGVVILDDFGQKRGSTPNESEYAELINCVSATPWSVPMAAVEDKGKRFKGKLILMTTNDPFPKPAEIMCKEAVWRRRNVLVEVTKKENSEGLPNPIRDCEYAIMNPMVEDQGQNYMTARKNGRIVPLKGLSFQELCSYIVPKFNNFWKQYLNAEVEKKVPEVDLNLFEAECLNRPIEDEEEIRNEEEEPIDLGLLQEIEDWLPVVGFLEAQMAGMDPENLQIILNFEDQDDDTDYDELFGEPKSYDGVHTQGFMPFECCSEVALGPNPLADYAIFYCHKIKRFLTPHRSVVPLVRNAVADELTYAESLCVEQYAYQEEYFCYNVNENNAFYRPWMHLRNAETWQEAQVAYDYWKCEMEGYEAQMFKTMFQRGNVCGEGFVPNLVDLGGTSAEVQDKTNEIVETLEKEEIDLYSIQEEQAQRTEEDLTKMLDERKAAEKRTKWFKVLKWITAIGAAFATAAAAYGLKEMLTPTKDESEESGPDVGLMKKFVRSFPRMMRKTATDAVVNLAAEATVKTITSTLMAEAAGKGSGDHRTLYPRKPIRLAKAEYSYEPLSEWQLMMDAEGTRDKNALDFSRYRLPRNLVYFKTVFNGATVGICGIGLRDRLVLLPYHFVHLFKGNTHQVQIQSIHGDSEEEIDFGKAKRVFHQGQMQDLAIVRLSMKQRMFVDITQNFVNESELDKLHRTEGMLVRVADYRGVRTTIEMTNFECIADTQTHETYRCGEDQYVILRGLYYRCNTAKGDCGSALIAINEHIRGKIIGIHIAGTQQGQGISVPVTKELVDRYLEDWEAQGLRERSPLTYMLQDLTPEEIDVKATMRPGGELRVVGVVKPEFGQRLPNKTDIIPSLIHGEITKPTTGPAVLTPGDERVDPVLRANGFSPMLKGLEKFEKAARPFPVRDLDLAEDVIAGILGRHTPYGMDRRLLTLDETINGVLTANFTRINMATSPGMPYKNYRGPGMKGKHFLFKSEILDNEEIRYTIDTERVSFKDNVKIGAILLENYEENDRKIRQGIVPDWYTYSNLKQERRKHAKLFAGETRLFECSPLDQTLLYRKYFGAFIAAMNQHCADLPSSVGINAEGPDWTRLYNRLSKFGGLVLAGDYKGWDGILPGDVMERALNIINRWYNDGKENQLARRTLIEAAIHTFILCRDTMILKNQGIPSGIPLTADINGLCNWIYMLCALFELARQHKYVINAEDVERMIEFAFYGDDHVVAPHPNIQHFFNFHNVKKFFEEKGITYTDAMKTGNDPNPLEPITKVTYLKRMFVPNEDFPDKIMGPIDMGTIDEEINWIRKSADDFEATFQNISAAKLQLVQHGRQVFEQKMRQINEVIERKRDADLRLAQSTRWTTFSVDYDNELQNWMEQFG